MISPHYGYLPHRVAKNIKVCKKNILLSLVGDNSCWGDDNDDDGDGKDFVL